MPIQLLPIGVPVTVVPTVTYALPAVACTIFADVPTAVLQQANNINMTPNVTIGTTNGVGRAFGAFFHSDVATTITLKRD